MSVCKRKRRAENFVCWLWRCLERLSFWSCVEWEMPRILALSKVLLCCTIKCAAIREDFLGAITRESQPSAWNMKQYKEPQTRTHTQHTTHELQQFVVSSRSGKKIQTNPQIICRYVTEFLFATNRTVVSFWFGVDVDRVLERVKYGGGRKDVKWEWMEWSSCAHHHDQ